MLINSGEIKTRVAKERQKTAAEINNYKKEKNELHVLHQHLPVNKSVKSRL